MDDRRRRHHGGNLSASERSLSSFRGECEIRVWLCRIAKNLWLTEQKKRARMTDAPPDEAMAALTDGEDFTAVIDDRQTARQILPRRSSVGGPLPRGVLPAGFR